MTTAGPVKAAIVTALTAAGLPNSAQVRYGPRGPTTAEDIVAVGGIEADGGQVARSTLGGQPRLAERYSIDVICSCTRQGGDAQQAATEAALTLYGAAVSALRGQTDETLGVSGVISALPLGGWSLSESDGADLPANGFNAAVRFRVEVSATV